MKIWKALKQNSWILRGLGRHSAVTKTARYDNATRWNALRWYARFVLDDIVAARQAAKDKRTASRMTCPRRVNEFGPQDRTPNQDYWRSDQGCSYCGGLNPQIFLSLVRQGRHVIPTDKAYKAYVSTANSERKVYYQHLSPDECHEFVNLYNDHTMQIGHPGHFYVRPYFMKPMPRLEAVS